MSLYSAKNLTSVSKKFTIHQKQESLTPKQGIYGCFRIGPFKGTKSLTFANLLRRTLLHEIPGTGIVQVIFQTPTHEFSTLPGVQESVIDIACSDRLSVDPKTNRCPDNDAKVDFSDCSVTPNKGDSEMSAVWTDKNYQTAQRAFYYVRVLENPSCRWSTYDALRAGVQPRPGTHKSIQERAWSSPIWVNNRL